MESLRKQVFKLISNDPTLPIKTLLNQFKGEKEDSIRRYRNQCLNKIYPSRKKVSHDISPDKNNTNNSVVLRNSKPSTSRMQSDFKIDPDLEHFEGIELIKHFTEKAIKNKILAMSERLKAMTIYVQFQDKSGTIKNVGTKKDQRFRNQFKSMTVKEVAKISSSQPKEHLKSKHIFESKQLEGLDND